MELLSPAKDIACGIAAVNHGADAVYIGASDYGARRSAANSVSDIEQLVKYAHRYHARIYVTLNTILRDEELEPVRRLAWQLYDAGVDAFIVQDMALLEMDMPPVPLHASTQMDNRTAEKVLFLEKCGFRQVVLARETPLATVREIASQTNAALEYFVHGALCVSYNGQCYLSAAACGRSANRGECAQYCRLPYDLMSADGKMLRKGKYLLSLNDLNLSEHLLELMDAGISSFKIEGRLKDENYVKNVTAYYRQKMDAILEGHPHYRASSSGKTTFFFTPNPQKTFSRGMTTYFLYGRDKNTVYSTHATPKSQGELIGTVKQSFPDSLSLQLREGVACHNGDGCYFIDKEGELCGFRVNRAEGARLFPNEKVMPERGVAVYRNYDAEFMKILSGKTAERRVAADIVFEETEQGFALRLTDEDGNMVSKVMRADKELAKNAARAEENLRAQLVKIGNTYFYPRKVEIRLSQMYFIPMSILAECRREAFDLLATEREQAYTPQRATMRPTSHPYVTDRLDYTGNVCNSKAEAFYRRHGVTHIESAYELQPREQVPVMFTKYCIKYSLGLCPKHFPDAEKVNEPLSLRHGNLVLRLQFDCKNCMMKVVK